MSVRHIYAKPGQHIAVHRANRGNNISSQSNDNIWLTVLSIAGWIAVIGGVGYLMYIFISWLLSWMLPLLVLAIPGYFVCLAMGSSKSKKH